MTGGKCAETEKSLKSQVKESALNCGARMTSGENCGKEDENVKMSLSGGLIWKVFSVCWRQKIRAVDLFPPHRLCLLCLYPLLTCRECFLYREYGRYVILHRHLLQLNDHSLCFYQLYLTNHCWHALPEQSLIFLKLQLFGLQHILSTAGKWVIIHMKSACLWCNFDTSTIVVLQQL